MAMRAEIPVVVGTNGSPSSMLAVRYAADQAGRRGVPLRVVTAIVLPGEADPGSRADVTLRQAAGLAAGFLPPERITTAAVAGWPSTVLREESADAALVVVGNRGFGGVRSALLGSVGVELAAEAGCPVVVVREDAAGAPPDGPVVVGVDGERHADALAAALQMAELLRAPLHVVHAWHAPLLAGVAQMPAPAGRHAARGPEDIAELEALVAALRGDRPGVEVTTYSRQGSPAQVLVDAGDGAQLVVLAGRGRGEVAGLLLGSTTQDVIHRARCPVMVVPPDAPGRPT